jgi:hypothetical protein
MRHVMIYDANGCQIISYGNGTSYTLRQFRPEGAYSCHVQGDDSEAFRNDMEAAENHDRPLSDLIADYSEIMERD